MLKPAHTQSGGTDCEDFLQWALPKLGLRWAGFRKVRRQVCKRLSRRLRTLGLADLAAYRQYLASHEAEWRVVDELCRVTITRFYRDRGVFDALASEILPALCRQARQRGDGILRCWSLGCGGGEEPYSLSIVWDLRVAPRFPGLGIEILATDSDGVSLARAQTACYGAGSLKDLPKDLLTAFEVTDSLYRLRPEYRTGVHFLRQDVRAQMPSGPFDLILCRNLAFTYFDEAGQSRIARALAARMPADAILVLGKHEKLPAACRWFRSLSAPLAIYQRLAVPPESADVRNQSPA